MKKENNEMVYINEQQKDAIIDYLHSRLGIYGVKDYQWEWKRTGKRDIGTQKIKASFGIFNHTIKECELHINAWANEKKDSNKCHLVVLSLRYKHFNCGHNGHDLNFKLKVWDDGRVYETEAQE